MLGWDATHRLGSGPLWLAMALMAPFCQTTGCNGQMSVIDNAVAVVVAFIFTNADRRLHPNNSNTDERQALALLAQAGPVPVVRLPKKCRVLSWGPITLPNESVTNAELLEYWPSTKGRTPYYYPARYRCASRKHAELAAA